MRESTRDMFKALLKDDSFTWDELAELFIKECKKPDMDDFIMLLNMRNNKKKK